MTPFLYRTKVVDAISREGQGFLMVRGREDGSWSINFHHWDRNSASCDTPEACYPAVLLMMTEWWQELEARHVDGLRAILSWPDDRAGHRPGWKRKEISKAAFAKKQSAAAWVSVRDQIKKDMAAAGWPTEI